MLVTNKYVSSPASYPDVSLSMKMCAQRKAGRRQPSVPFPWSLAAHHRSLAFRACLYDEKNEAPEEEAVSSLVMSVVIQNYGQQQWLKTVKQNSFQNAHMQSI